MIEELRRLRPQIDALCQRHHVRRLELFGSAATGRVGPDSDVDFLVDFVPLGGAVSMRSITSLSRRSLKSCSVDRLIWSSFEA